jgi:hypothetical protein
MEEMWHMRSKTGWGAVLLAAGVALAPATARAQMGVDKPADPVVPLPLYHPRADVVGGFYTAAEFVMFRQTNPIGHQLLAVRGFVDVDGAVTGDLNGTVVNPDNGGNSFIIRGPLVPGNFLGTGTPALFSDDLRGSESFQPGYKMTIGYRFNSGSALEASWMHLVSARYTANASLIPTNFANLGAAPLLADSFLFVPFFNLPPEFAGPPNKVALGNPQSVYGIFNGANNVAIDFTQHFDQADIRGRVPWFQDECLRLYGLAGGRFAWIWENFRMRAVSADFTGASAPSDVGLYYNTVSNRMYGPFAGFGVERYIGAGFAIGLEMDAALLLDVVKERAAVQNGDRETADYAFVKVKKSATNFAVSPEVTANAQVYWYPWEGVQIRAGYNFMAFFDTIQAKDPVIFDARSFDPNWTNRAVRFLDGFNAGIGFIF